MRFAYQAQHRPHLYALGDGAMRLGVSVFFLERSEYSMIAFALHTVHRQREGSWAADGQ